MELPISFNQQMIDSSMFNPTATVANNVFLTRYFVRYLLQKVISVSKWKLPGNWSDKYFLYALHTCGNVVVFKTDKFGVIPQHCTLAGRNVFYQPSRAIVSNPLIERNLDLHIGKNCVLFTMTADYGGVYDLVNFYASLMSLAVESFCANTFNSRLAYVFAASGKNMAESMKKAADDVLSGKPYVVADKALFGPDGKLNAELFLNNLRQNFIAPELFDMLKDIENKFNKAVGLPAAYSLKKERMLTGELDSSNTEGQSRYKMWLDGWRKSCKDVKDMFGVDVSVELRGDDNEA